MGEALSKKEKLLAAAQKNLLKGQVAKAIKDYEKIVESDPADVRNRQKLGELYSREGMVEAALETYESVARHYSQNGFYLKAMAVYKQMQKVDPSQRSVYYRLAELNEKQGLLGNALAEYRQLVQLLKDDEITDETVKVLEKMQQLDPDNLKVRMDLIETHARNQNVDGAAEVFGQTLEHLRQKKDLTCAGRLRQALDTFCPGNMELKVGLGRLLVEGSDPTPGIELLQEILAEEPDQGSARLLLAEGYHRIEAFEQEQEIYRQLLELNPVDLELREKYVAACLACGNGLTAIESLDGWTAAFFDAGKLTVLKGFYENLNELFPENEGVLKILHDVYEKTGEGGKLFDLYSSGESQSSLGSDEEDYSYPAEKDVSAETGEEGETETYGDLPVEEPVVEEAERSEALAADLDTNADSISDVAASSSISVKDDLNESDGFELEIELEMTGTEISAEDFETNTFEFDNLELEASDRDSVGETDFFDGLEDLDLDLDLEGPLDGPAEAGDVDEAPEGKPVSGESRCAKPVQDREKSRFDGSMSQFKKGIEDQVSAEDTETHFNLGIAYKEMGLLDDAVEQFDKALNDPDRRLDCLTLKGLCLLEKGDFEQASETFKTGLALQDITEEERVSLYYELGLLFVACGQPLEALDSFQCVADVHPLFREVEDNIRNLRKELGLDDNGAENSGKNRVSYI